VLKNIERPVRVFRVALGKPSSLGLVVAPRSATRANGGKPSVAVLTFDALRKEDLYGSRGQCA
jgi:hypothetical protein